MESLTLQIKGLKPEEKAVTLLNDDWDQACDKTTPRQQNFTYQLHGMEFTKEEWRVTLISTMKSNPGIN